MIKVAFKVSIYTCLFVLSVYIFDIEVLSKNINGDSNVQAEEVSNVYNACKKVRKEEYIWKYKIVNKKRYRRLYNKSTCKWAGDWEPVS